jgi:hypothetical protein
MEHANVDVTTLLSAFLVLAVPVAIAITKATDFIRNSLDKADTAPKWMWNVVPFALAIGYCLLFEVNFHESMAGLHPRVVELMTGVGGQIATGFGVGALASGWHELLSKWSAQSKGIHQ